MEEDVQIVVKPLLISKLCSHVDKEPKQYTDPQNIPYNAIDRKQS